MINLKGKTRLPEEYQEVEYLEGDGKAYIDTLINPVNKGFETEIITLSAPSKNQGIFGARQTPAAGSGSYNIFHFTSAYFRLDYIGNSGTQVRYLDNNVISYNPNNKVFTLNDTNYTCAKSKCDYNFLLFTFNNAGVPSPDCFSGSFKYFKMYDNNELILDLVPCYLKSTKEAGMYDLVSGQFFTNQGTGAFKVGANVYAQPKNITINKDGNAYDCKRVVCNDTVIWEKASKYADKDMTYFTIKPSSPLCLVKLQGYGTLASIDLSKGSGQYLDYRFDNEDGTYTDWVHYTNGTQIASQGKPIQFKGDILTSQPSGNNYWHFESNSQPFDAYGTLRSIYGTKSLNYMLHSLFKDSYIIDASGIILPLSTGVGQGFFQSTFEGSKVVKAPKINGNLRNYHCYRMFYDCADLVYGPDMSGIIFPPKPTYAFSYMFYNCTNLLYAPMNLDVINCGSSMCENMLLGCTSLKKLPKISAETIGGRGLRALLQNNSYIKELILPAYKYTDTYSVQNLITTTTNLRYIKLGIMSHQFVNSMFDRYLPSEGTLSIEGDSTFGRFSDEDIKTLFNIPSSWNVERNWLDFTVNEFTPYVYDGGLESNVNITFKNELLGKVKEALILNPTNYKVIFTDLDGNQTESSFYRDDFYVIGNYVQYSCESTKQGLYVDDTDCYLDSYDWEADNYAITSIASIEIVRLSDEATVAAYSIDNGIAMMSLDEDEEYNEINEETDETNQEF